MTHHILVIENDPAVYGDEAGLSTSFHPSMQDAVDRMMEARKADVEAGALQTYYIAEIKISLESFPLEGGTDR